MYINIEHTAGQYSWLSEINTENFEQYALSVFRYQYEHCSVYHDFVTAIGRNPDTVQSLKAIPFLPISFFKTHTIVSGEFTPEVIFESSGTTSTQNSKHLVKDTGLYQESFLIAFEQFYGDPQDYVFLCLLPSYLERGNSSLVYMADELIRKSGRFESGFYLNEWEQLALILQQLKQKKQKVMLLGVTFALLDFAEQYPMDLSGITVMETGGMKGRREEWTREQVHYFLKEKWNLSQVHSEYGMTELLSQAYSKGDGVFNAASTTKVFVRDENDPFEIKTSGSGCLNIIDLANIHSCSFIATDDISKLAADGSFEVLGRLDNSALRGCSLMVV
jgi:phenylacetate-coenzyme A ligase PaaK-like adenylate-forming protein